MSGLTGNNILAGTSGQATGYDIDQSLRFYEIDTSRLERTPSSAGNRKTWTWSGWVKRSHLNVQNFLFSSADSSVRNWFGFYNNELWFDHTNGGYVKSGALYRDVSSWYHIVVAWDTTQATDSNRIKIYINGEQISLTVNSWPALNQDGEINNTSGMYIGSLNTYAGYYYDGYMSEVNFVDGQALRPASFGETNSATNQWIAKKYAGSYGTNGFYLPFSNTELNNFVDSSSSSHAITANGNVVNSRAQEKIGTSSVKFDGTGDYLSIPNSSDFNFGTGDFTFEGWFYTDSGTDQILFSQYQDTSNRWYLRLDNRSAQEGIGFYNHNGGIDIEATDNTWPGVNQWVHMAFVRASGVITIYINGSAITLKTNTSPNGTFTNNTGTLRIGDYNGGSNYSGYIDEIRISNSARYTSNFTTKCR